MFFDVVDRKQACIVDYRKIDHKGLPYFIFWNRLTHDFGQNLIFKKRENGDSINFWSIYFLRICEKIQVLTSKASLSLNLSLLYFRGKTLEMHTRDDWKVEGKTLSRDANLVFRNSIVLAYK